MFSVESAQSKSKGTEFCPTSCAGQDIFQDLHQRTKPCENRGKVPEAGVLMDYMPRKRISNARMLEIGQKMKFSDKHMTKCCFVN